MSQVDQDCKCILHDRVGLSPLDVHDETHTTRIMLKLRIIEPLLGGQTRPRHPAILTAHICSFRHLTYGISLNLWS
jgi:hypothetical protein